MPENYELPPHVAAAVEEAASLQAQFSEIQSLAEAYSERVAKLQEDSVGLGSQSAQLAFRLSDGGFQGAGAALAVGAGVAVAARAASAVWQKWREWTTEAQLRELLLKKQQLARAKLSAVAQLVPAVERSRDKVGDMLAADAALLPVSSDIERLRLLRSCVESLFNTLHTMTVTAATARFALAEFEAWVAGRHTSTAIPPDGQLLARDSIDRLVVCSRAPETPTVDAVRDMTVGTLFLLSSPGIARAMRGDLWYRELCGAVVRARLAGFANPGARARWFSSMYREFLRENAVTRRIVSRALTSTAFATMCIGLGATYPLYGPTLSSAWAVQSALESDVPCALESVPADSIHRVAPWFEAQISDAENQCAADRHDRACSALAGYLRRGGALPGEPILTVEQRPFYERMRERRLLSADLAVDRDELACGDTERASNVWRAFVSAAARSPAAWSEDAVPSSELLQGLRVEGGATAEVVDAIRGRTRAALARATARHATDDERASARAACQVCEIVACGHRPCRNVDRALARRRTTTR